MDTKYRNVSGKIIGKNSEDTFCKNVKKSKQIFLALVNFKKEELENEQ
ncbi:MAG: hypothetical protein IPP66_09020 [Anaerolineales bacterium]|nr:hypothetical protein [Anaerolineales bacterium]